MAQWNYVVQHHGLGAIQHIPVLDVDRSVVAAACGSNAVVDVFVTLTDTWAVQLGGRHLGVIAAVDREEYAELDWLLSAGITPQITARIERKGLKVWLRLPRSGLCLPVNNPPAGPWVMLSPGPAIALPRLPRIPDLNPGDRLQLLFTLRLGADAVTVYMGQQIVSVLDADTTARLRPVLELCNRHGVQAVTYGYHAPRAGRRSITIYPGTVTFEQSPADSRDLAAVN